MTNKSDDVIESLVGLPSEEVVEIEDGTSPDDLVPEFVPEPDVPETAEEVYGRVRYYGAEELGMLCDLARVDALVVFARWLLADKRSSWKKTETGMVREGSLYKPDRHTLDWVAYEARKKAAELLGEQLEGVDPDTIPDYEGEVE